MSESMNAARGNIRRQLLTSASALALLASVYGTGEARADDSDHPIVWIEVGGAFDQMSASETEWSPPNLTPPQSTPPPLPFGKLPAVGYDADLKLSFTPQDSDWVYSAAIRYGRAKFGPKHSHDQASKFRYFTSINSQRPTNYNFANTSQDSHTSHAIIDFTAGKDVGLGIFGHGKSTINFGVRIAQLSEKAVGQLTAFTNVPRKYAYNGIGHKAELAVNRSFTGIGPSISWDASAPVAGSLSEGFSIDWGANGAILFGRQKANVLLQTKDTRYPPGTYYYKSSQLIDHDGIPTVLSHSTQTPMRAKTVLVFNVGGFAGLSWHLPNGKISLGYRADFFFGAIDGGLLTSQKETRGFYGPFANVSIGIGG